MCLDCKFNVSTVGRFLFWALVACTTTFLCLAVCVGYVYSTPPQCTLPSRLKQCTLPTRKNPCGKKCSCGCEDGESCRCLAKKTKKITPTRRVIYRTAPIYYAPPPQPVMFNSYQGGFAPMPMMSAGACRTG